jgi:hypothetical protein
MISEGIETEEKILGCRLQIVFRILSIKFVYNAYGNEVLFPDPVADLRHITLSPNVLGLILGLPPFVVGIRSDKKFII